jgi:hypothetical protein
MAASELSLSAKEERRASFATPTKSVQEPLAKFRIVKKSFRTKRDKNVCGRGIGFVS